MAKNSTPFLSYHEIQVDDVDIYRTLEDYLDIADISFMECQGRINLLKVFERRNEINDNVLFICDSDLWVILGKPETL